MEHTKSERFVQFRRKISEKKNFCNNNGGCMVK